MLQELLVDKPPDPLSYLRNLLTKQSVDVPKIIIYGPPSSGQYTVGKAIARKLRSVLINPKHLLEKESGLIRIECENPEKMSKLILERIQKDDCKNKGWILEGYPRTREQALVLQAEGVLADHWVHLQAPDTVLLERYNGKRVDPITGDIYHLVFDPPTDHFVMERLKEEDGGVHFNMHEGLKYYHRHCNNLTLCYKHISKVFDADQPSIDIINQVYTFLCTRRRSASPHTPRVILVGPIGAGKSWQASQLSEKYRLVNVDCGILLKQSLASGSQLAYQMKPFHDRQMPIPDDMVMKLVTHRLSQVDCATRGWVLHSFPFSREQAELLNDANLAPNRVFFLDVPEDTIKERLCWRRVDPVTGERYHLLYNPPLTPDIKERLVIHPKDSEESVDSHITEYNSNISDLEDYYTQALNVNGDQDPFGILETLESYIINPLPKQAKWSES